MWNRKRMKHQSKYLPIPFRTARVDPNTERANHIHPHPKAHGTSKHSRWRVRHRKASTGLSEVLIDVDRTCGWKADLLGCRKSAGTSDARISRMSMQSALNGKDTKHPKNANFGNSTSVFPDPKRVSSGLQSPQPSGAVPATPEELSSTAPPFILADDPSTEMLPPEWLKLLTQIAPVGRGGRTTYDLIAEMQLRPHSGDPSFQDWRCWRKWEHATCNTGRITSPQFCNHHKMHDLDLQIIRKPRSQDCLRYLLWMAKTPNISKTPQVSFQAPKAYPRDCNHNRHPEPSPATPEELSSTAPPLPSADDPSTEMLPPEWWKLSFTSIAPAGRGGRTKTSFWRSIIPGLEMLEKTHNTQHGRPSHPHNFANWLLDSEPKCHDTAWFRFTDRHKTSITRMSMPPGLNGNDTKHLKDANLRVSNYKSLSRPQKFIEGATINMLQIRNTVFWYRDKSNFSMANAWNISPNPFKSPFRTARVDPKKSFSPQTLSVQTTVSHTPKPCPGTWYLQTLPLTSLSQQGFHRTEWSVPWRRSHLRLQGRSTWFRKSRGTPDARISRMSTPPGLNGKDTTHLKDANLGNSRSLFPDPKIVSRGLQSPQTSGAVPTNSRGALQHGTSSFLCRGPLDRDVSARVVEVFHLDCTCGTRRQNYDLISDMQLYKTSFSRSIIPGLEMLEKTGTHNMQHWPHHIPTILQPWRIDF